MSILLGGPVSSVVIQSLWQNVQVQWRDVLYNEKLETTGPGFKSTFNYYEISAKTVKVLLFCKRCCSQELST